MKCHISQSDRLLVQIRKLRPVKGQLFNGHTALARLPCSPLGMTVLG